MRALKFSFLVGVVLVLAPPCFPHFVKAALGFRLGYSPTEQGYGQKGILGDTKKSMGVQLLSGVNNGGWHSGGLKAAGSGYGLGLGSRTARSAQAGPLDAHNGQGGVRHLRILGMNLYLGGRAAQLGFGTPLAQFQPPMAKKSILNHSPYTGIIGTLARPFHHLNLGANIGAGLKPVTSAAPNGGQNIGGIAGIRASVGSPKYGIGFNLGYKQNLINTKSPLGWALGLGNQGQKLASPVAPAYPAYIRGGQDQVIVGNGGLLRGQDQVIVGNGGLLRGHGQDNSLFAYSPVAQQSIYQSFPQNLESPINSGYESQQASSSQTMQQQSNDIQNPVASASNQQASQRIRAPKQLSESNNQQQQQNQQQQNQQQQNQNNQQKLNGQQSVLQAQQSQTPQFQNQQGQQQQNQQQHQHRFFGGPLALGSTMRNNFLSLFRSRPSVLRPTPYQYSFNTPVNQQALGSGPVRSVQRPQNAPAQNEIPQGWSTLFPVNGQQASASNSFLNPVPANGQSLSKLQASLRPGTVTNVPLHQQQLQGAAQNQVPYVQQPRYSGFLSQGLRGIFGLGRQPPQQYPQQYYPQQQQFQRPIGAGGLGGGQGQAGQLAQAQLAQAQLGAAQLGAAQYAQQQGLAQQGQQIQTQDYNLFSQQLQNPFQNLQNFQNSVQQSPFFQSQIQDSPVQSAQGSNTAQNKQNSNSPLLPFLPQFPFTADSPSFQAHPAFRYSHSTHSKPVNMGQYTVNLDVTNNSGGGSDASGSASSTPVYGPGGRRIKKTKKTRGDIIIMKKKDSESPSAGVSAQSKMIRQLPLGGDIMETSASTNQVVLASSLGSTSWTPMVVVDPPKFARKSLEAPDGASVQVIERNRPIIISTPKIKAPPRISTASAVVTAAPASPERTMILRRRSFDEAASPTVVPTSAPTTSAPTTTTTTVAPSITTSPSTPVPSSTEAADTTEIIA